MYLHSHRVGEVAAVVLLKSFERLLKSPNAGCELRLLGPLLGLSPDRHRKQPRVRPSPGTREGGVDTSETVDAG
jgi:hypothetical protein